MNPNNLPTLSQAAAGAALSDLPYMRATCALIASAGAGAALRLADAGIATRESSTNFLLLDLKTADAARAADAHLRSLGIFLRPQSGAGLPQTLRMTIGPPDHVDLAVAALEGWARETRHETLPWPRPHRGAGPLHQHQSRTRPRADGAPGPVAAYRADGRL
jgi:histidinol-phosphate aminotransferase